MNYTISEFELKMVCDPEIIFAKNRVIQTVIKMFGNLSEEFQTFAKQSGLNLLIATPPKISKGENYLGLPYVVLDYPREFGKEDKFAIRNFFWWGNFFSTTLFISGKYLELYKGAIQNAVNKNQLSGWEIQIDQNPWMHHTEGESHKEIDSQVKIDELNIPFIKLVKKIPLQEWDKIQNNLKENFGLLAGILKS